jgi:4-amino-4-deoxy-L-arabinose transferase-like glycosyltransferase
MPGTDTRSANTVASRRTLTDRTLLGLVLSAALLTRLIGLDWALPHTYEEATPLRVAVSMWGWEHDGAPTLNPSFFNYPSLAFYIHFLAQGLWFLILRLTGVVHSAADWSFIYLTDPTRAFVVSRLVGTIFGVLTVLFVFKIARAAAGPREAFLAALFLAINPFHVARSQMIEVDIPLTFFFALAAWVLVRIATQGRRSDYLLAGMAIGLATSSKYTGAVLVVPLLAAHLIASPSVRSWRWLLVGVVLSVAVFAVTSPYVFLDWNKFRAALALEREHMRVGHFGVSDTPAIVFYGHSLAMRLVGIPGLVLAVIGAVKLLRASRRSALVLLAVIFTYVGIIMTWSMKADAYALPVLPLILCFSASGLIAIADGAGRVMKNAPVQRATLAILALGMVAYDVTRIAEHREAMQHDVRTDAQDWIEANLPAGAFIVCENYGPDLLKPAFLLQMDPRLRARVLERWKRRPIYAFVALPMFQSHPELSAEFYDLELYPQADYIITTGPIRGRYEKDPARFPAQTAFYEQLKERCRKIQEFGEGNTRLTVYGTAPGEPFARRANVPAPPALENETRTGRESGFYFSMGTNYEYFHYLEQAATSYRLALVYGSANPQVVYACAFGYARCLDALGRGEEAQADLRRLQAGIKDRRLAAAIGKLLESMTGP